MARSIDRLIEGWMVWCIDWVIDGLIVWLIDRLIDSWMDGLIFWIARSKRENTMMKKRRKSLSPPEVAALCPSCVMCPRYKRTTKVSRHVPNLGDWRRKLTNLTKSLNSTTEGTFYRPHVVFCNARYHHSWVFNKLLLVLCTQRLHAIHNLRTSHHSL